MFAAMISFQDSNIRTIFKTVSHACNRAGMGLFSMVENRKENCMNITINGSTEAGDYSSVAGLLAEQGLDPKLVVVELNGKILPSADFSTTRLKEGDSVEIVQFVAGG